MDELLGKAATEEGDAPFWRPAAAVFLFTTEPNAVLKFNSTNTKTTFIDACTLYPQVLDGCLSAPTPHTEAQPRIHATIFGSRLVKGGRILGPVSLVEGRRA